MLSFAESSFFPIPPDPILINMTLEKPSKWKRYALITTVASVLGGIFGYLIGFALFESFGNWIIDTYQLQDKYIELGHAFANNGLITIFAAALTPIPYKIFTISAGAFKLNFLTFLSASIVGRGLRFAAVGFITSVMGIKYKDQIKRYIDRISVVILLIVIAVAIIYSRI
jgi:membrane protein YqaA with SNARE-associated domain